MRPLLFASAALALTACAEFDTAPEQPVEPTSASDRFETGSSAIIYDDEGNPFEVSVIHDGTLLPIDEELILDSVQVVGVQPSDPDVVRPAQTIGAFVPPVNPDLVPDASQPINIYVTGLNPDVLMDQYRWDWVEDIDMDQVEAQAEDICPPWH